MSEQEFGTKLKLDDEASEALEKIKSGFEKVEDQTEKVTHHFKEFARQALAVAAGFQLSLSIDSLKEFGSEIVHAAVGAGDQIKTLTGLLSIADKTGAEFDVLSEQAAGAKEELERMGIAAGVSSDSMIDAFGTLAERSNKSKAELLELTQQAAIAGRAIPGGVATLANSFRNLESGFIRPRDAIVQFVKQTGVLKGTAKDIAKNMNAQMQAGHSDLVFKIAEEAVSRMAVKAAKIAPTFAEITQSIKDIRENIFEAFGTPIVKALIPVLDRVRHSLIDNKEAIEKWATMVGDKAAEWVSYAADKIQEGFQWIQTHGDEIMKALQRGGEAIVEAFKFVLAHKEEIAMMLAVKFGGELAHGAAGVGSSLISTGTNIAGGAATAGTIVSGLTAIGVTGSAAAMGLGAAGAAIVALGAAGWQFAELWRETRGFMSDEEMNYEATLEAIKRAANEGLMTTSQFGDLQQKLRATGKAAGLSSDAIEKLNSQYSKQYAPKHDIVEEASIGLRMARKGGDVPGGLNLELDAWDKAFMSKDTKMMEIVARVFSTTGSLSDALIESGKDITGGYGALADMIEKIGGPKDLALTLRALAEKSATPPKVNFNIGTMNIKQDFRDADPDRIIAVFRDDLVRHAVSPLQGRGVFST